MRKKDKEIQIKLQDIESNGELGHLEAFKDKALWHDMSLDNRELLAVLYSRLAQKQLVEDESTAATHFKLAAEIAPHNHDLLYQQGLSYYLQPHTEASLTQACECFESATKLKDNDFTYWYIWGSSLKSLGLIQENISCFLEALQKFQTASLFPEGIDGEEWATFYWHWGQVYFFSGKLAGEALDFRNAIDKYKEAVALYLDTSSLWNSYGDALIELAFLIGSRECFFEAITIYQKAIALTPNDFQALINLACAYQCIYELTNDDQYYHLSEKEFRAAVDINDRQFILWIKWGQLQATYGKIMRDVAYLNSSIKKYERADALEPNHPGLLSRWGEVEMLLGANTEQVDLLRSAERKIARSIELNSEGSEIWYLYGVCHNEMGRYFANEKFYEQGIEKFQHGLSLNQDDPLLWYGLAMSFYAIGDMRSDMQVIEKAVRYYAKVLELGGQHFYQFWNDWGVALLRLGEMTGDQSYIESAVDKFEQIIGKEIDFESDSDTDPMDLEWLYNYGCALDFLGDFTEDLNHYEKAIAILTSILKIDPDYLHARYNLALSLSHLGESVSSVDVLYKALEQFKILLESDPEDEAGWNDWGLTLMHMAQLLEEVARPEPSRRLYEQAEHKFMQAINLGSLSSHYNLACLHALSGNYSIAIHYLDKAAAANVLPSVDDMMNDEWLEDLRETHEFRVFISMLSMRQQKK